jgi:hypothetical protein
VFHASQQDALKSAIVEWMLAEVTRIGGKPRRAGLLADGVAELHYRWKDEGYLLRAPGYAASCAARLVRVDIALRLADQLSPGPEAIGPAERRVFLRRGA